MKRILLTTITFLILLGCVPSTTSSNINNHQEKLKTDAGASTQVNQDSSSHPRNLLTTADAEKILGKSARLTDSTTTIEGGILKYKCAYTANSKDPKTGRPSLVYFLFEKYANVSSAKKVYSSIKTDNENHQGIKELNDLGDEAYFHSDGQNFYFIMVRKGERIFRMKVNKITSTTSLDEFNMIAKKITAAL